MSGRREVGLFGILFELLPVALACGLFAAIGVVHVTSKALVVRAGYELSRLEGQRRELGREQDRLRLELATLKSPARLEKLAREQLGLAPPAAGAVISLSKGSPPVLSSKGSSPLARKEDP